MTDEPFIDFQGKRVVVTGASSGIGRAIAIELGRRGASLVLIGRNEAELEKTVSAVPGTPVDYLNLDLNDLSDIEPEIKKYAKEKGRIYGLCNNAGIVETRPLKSCDTKHLQSLLNVNFLANIELTRVVSRRDVMETDGGVILFISSVYGIVGVSGEIGYSATKGAVASAARAMAVELAKRKIRVNTLAPGFVKTKMTDDALSVLTKEQAQGIISRHPLGVGTPEDVARAAAFLLAPQNAWFTGTELIIDGGYTAQ